MEISTKFPQVCLWVDSDIHLKKSTQLLDFDYENFQSSTLHIARFHQESRDNDDDILDPQWLHANSPLSTAIRGFLGDKILKTLRIF